MIWKVPTSHSNTAPIFVAVSCCYCVSTQHLIGDCPRRNFPLNSTSWSLKMYDPSKLAGLQSFAELKGQAVGAKLEKPRYVLPAGPAERAPSPDSDDALSRFGHSMPIKRQPPRGNIQFDGGIARGRGSDQRAGRQYNGSGSRYVPDNDDNEYRDRDQYFGHNTRQRSLSPGPYASRRGRGNSGRQATSGRSRGRGGAASRGRKPMQEGDTYRPMPSAAKRAWAKHRT
jgi:protein AIR1/2